MYCPYYGLNWAQLVLSPKVVVTLHVDDRLVTWPGLLAAEQSITSDLCWHSVRPGHIHFAILHKYTIFFAFKD